MSDSEEELSFESVEDTDEAKISSNFTCSASVGYVQ